MMDRTLTPAPGQFWLYCEDMASAAIGPFPNLDAVAEHVAKNIRRGDGGTFTVYKGFRPSAMMTMRPEEDIAI